MNCICIVSFHPLCEWILIPKRSDVLNFMRIEEYWHVLFLWPALTSSGLSRSVSLQQLEETSQTLKCFDCCFYSKAKYSVIMFQFLSRVSAFAFISQSYNTSSEIYCIHSAIPLTKADFFQENHRHSIWLSFWMTFFISELPKWTGLFRISAVVPRRRNRIVVPVMSVFLPSPTSVNHWRGSEEEKGKK